MTVTFTNVNCVQCSMGILINEYQKSFKFLSNSLWNWIITIIKNCMETLPNTKPQLHSLEKNNFRHLIFQKWFCSWTWTGRIFIQILYKGCKQFWLNRLSMSVAQCTCRLKHFHQTICFDVILLPKNIVRKCCNYVSWW